MFNPRRGRQHSFVEIDHEIFSTVILSLPAIVPKCLPVSEVLLSVLEPELVKMYNSSKFCSGYYQNCILYVVVLNMKVENHRG